MFVFVADPPKNSICAFYLFAAQLSQSRINTAPRELACFQSFQQSNYVQNTGTKQKDYTYYWGQHTNTEVLGRLICVMKSSQPLRCERISSVRRTLGLSFRSLSLLLSHHPPLAQSDVSLQHMGSLSECTVSVLTPFLITHVNDWSPGPGGGNGAGSPAWTLMARLRMSSVVGNGGNEYLQMAWELRD